MIGVVKNMLSERKRKGFFVTNHERVKKYARIITLD